MALTPQDLLTFTNLKNVEVCILDGTRDVMTKRKTSRCLDGAQEPQTRLGIYSRVLDTSKHKPKQIEEEHVRGANLIVAMGKGHKKFIEEHFGCSSRFFNEICYGKQTEVLDVDEKIPNWKENMHFSIPYAKEVIKYIRDSMRFFVETCETIL